MGKRIASATAALLLFAACSGGGTPTAPPSTAPAATPSSVATATSGAEPSTTPTAQASAPASATAATTPATPVPSAPSTPVGPVDVEALVPTQAGGITLTPQTIAADDFIGAYENFDDMLGVLGRTPADVSIVQAQGSNPQTSEIMIVQAFRVAGADATALMNGMLEFWKVENDVAAPITIAGKQLIVQGHPDTDAQYKSYYYSYGDTVFRLGYNGDDFDEQIAALVSQLP